MKTPALRKSRKTEAPTESKSLSNLRSELGLTQTQVANQLRSSQQAVLKIERSSDPRLSTLDGYVRALGRALGVESHCVVMARIAGRDHEVALPLQRELEPEAQDTLEERVTNTIPTPATTGRARAWRLRAWDDLQIEQAWLDGGYISMSDDEIGDLSHHPSDRQVSQLLRKAFPDRTDQAIGTFVSYWRMFTTEMTPGDVVAVPLSGRRVAIGEITGPYYYDGEERETKLRHRRTVRWLVTSMPRANLDDDLRKVVNAPGTVCSFRAPGAASRLGAGR